MAKRYILRCHENCTHIHTITNVAVEGFWLSCPKCNDTRDARSQTLFQHGKMCNVRCASCKHMCASKKWRCPCGKAWITCSACRAKGFACKATQRSLKRRLNVYRFGAPLSLAAGRDEMPPWVPRAAKRATRPSPQHIELKTGWPDFALTQKPDGRILIPPTTSHCIARASPMATATTATPCHKRGRGAFSGKESRSKRRLIFTPGPKLKDRFAHLV